MARRIRKTSALATILKRHCGAENHVAAMEGACELHGGAQRQAILNM